MRAEKSRLNSDMPEVLIVARGLIALWTFIVYIGAAAAQSFVEIVPIPMLLFTGVMAIHTFVHWNAHLFVRKLSWIYFILQGALLYTSAYLIPVGYPVVFIGLYPVLMAQSFGVFNQKAKFGVAAAVYFVLFCASMLLNSGVHLFVLLLPFYILLSVISLTVANLFAKQTYARMRMQVFLGELEQAHRKVEELTVANERQRIARDLHDTLAQGLAGLVMQLEAADAHLTKGNAKRAHEIIQQSMVRARQSLAEARETIDDLRSLSSAAVDLSEVLHEETKRFGQATGIPVSANINIAGDMPKLLVEHGRYIVRESLTNIARHAEATEVRLAAVQRNHMLLLEIIDNGKGFDPDIIGKKLGHYGLIGIQERTRILGGTFKLDSGPNGTAIRIELPLRKEESG